MQENDTRLVTWPWETLIEALRDANVQNEANILEQHCVNSTAISQPGGVFECAFIVNVAWSSIGIRFFCRYYHATWSHYSRS